VDIHEHVTPFGFGTSAVPRFKPWYGSHDAENVLFVSVHGYGPRERGLDMPSASFYPGTGPTRIPDLSSLGHVRGEGSDISSDDDEEEEGSRMDDEERGEEEAEAAATHKRALSAGNAIGGATGEDDDDEEEEDSDFDPDLNDMSSNDSDAANRITGTAVFSLGGHGAPARAPDGYSIHMPKTRKLFHMYEPVVGAAAVRTDATDDSAARRKSGTAANKSFAEPLILDVGVPLPKEETNPASYRHQWRNYFR
jgi:hypothetical protein